MGKTISMLVSWNLIKNNNNYYIISSHYKYLEYISKKYNKIYLISTIKRNFSNNNLKLINKISNVYVIELPNIEKYIRSIKYIIIYFNTIKKYSKKSDLFYCRVPDPFCWMPAILFRKNSIMHYVGDSIEATRYNEQWSKFKKLIMIIGYIPEYILTVLASKKSMVFVNGFHLAKKLRRYGIMANPVISSTVSENELNEIPIRKKNNKKRINLIYIGYIRYSKGMNSLKLLWKKMQENNIKYSFHIIGTGEMIDDIRYYISENKLEESVKLHGYMDKREIINDLLRESDLFIFPSLSEGSPRVVIEAMSLGVPVISTPVGALPFIFKDKEDIRYFYFNDVEKIIDIIKEYMINKEIFYLQSVNAFEKVKNNYTLEKYLDAIFNIGENQ